MEEKRMRTEKRGLSAAVLKWIAIVLMTVNHLCIGLRNSGIQNYFVNQAGWYLTRVAFVLFAYQVGEGLHYTHNRKKYILLLFVFAVLSELPYDLCFFGRIFTFERQNVLWTLGIGAATAELIEETDKKPLQIMMIAFAAMAFATWMRTDYAFLGVITVISFSIFRQDKIKQLLITAVLFVLFTVTFYLHSFAENGTPLPQILTSQYFRYLVVLEWHGLAAWPLLLMYDGSKGRNIGKWFFYWFYPGHLLLLFVMEIILVATR